jgi:transcriptional regulator with XRE-family HTH domain
VSARADFRRFRRTRRITQAQLAQALGITVRAVKYIEAGERKLGYRTEERFVELVERHKKAAGVRW